jgi:hypothetical protein
VSDSTGRGTPERVEIHAEGRLVRVELDEDRDGRVDLWNFYDPEGRLEKQEQDRSGDGQVDAWVTIDVATGKETRVLLDRNGDGQVDSWRTNDAQGRTTDLEEDENGDGKPDRWVYFEGGAPTRFEQDTTGDGKIDLRGQLAPDGEVAREERDETAMASSTSSRSSRAGSRCGRRRTPTATAPSSRW